MCVWSWVVCGVIVLFTVSLLVARLRAAEGLNTAERCELCLARAFLFFNCAHAFSSAGRGGRSVQLAARVVLCRILYCAVPVWEAALVN